MVTCQDGFEASVFASARGVGVALETQRHIAVVGADFRGKPVVFALERPLRGKRGGRKERKRCTRFE